MARALRLLVPYRHAPRARPWLAGGHLLVVRSPSRRLEANEVRLSPPTCPSDSGARSLLRHPGCIFRNRYPSRPCLAMRLRLLHCMYLLIEASPFLLRSARRAESHGSASPRSHESGYDVRATRSGTYNRSATLRNRTQPSNISAHTCPSRRCARAARMVHSLPCAHIRKMARRPLRCGRAVTQAVAMAVFDVTRASESLPPILLFALFFSLGDVG